MEKKCILTFENSKKLQKISQKRINLLLGKQFFVSKDARYDSELQNDSNNTHNFGLDMVLSALYKSMEPRGY